MDKKYRLDLMVASVDFLGPSLFRLVLNRADGEGMPEMNPGQFVQIRVEGSPKTFLRRPISIYHADNKELWLLIQIKGDGTEKLANLRPGDVLDVMLPLGNGYTMPQVNANVLLVGGGVGVAPLYYFGEKIKEKGIVPKFLLGARNASAIPDISIYKQLGEVFLTTEDGSEGEKGFVTNHSVLTEAKFDMIYVCGPKPMMVAIAKWAKAHNVNCEVSLENMMACGLGACLCCVEKTVKGNVCVCTEGPVFNINELTWQI